MFTFIRFVIRNKQYTVKKARRAYKTHKVMQKYRSEHPECAWCGRNKKLDVHHIIPVSVAPERAGDYSNLMMLCRKPQCHLIVGHDTNYGRRYVENIEEICNKKQVVRTTNFL